MVEPHDSGHQKLDALKSASVCGMLLTNDCRMENQRWQRLKEIPYGSVWKPRVGVPLTGCTENNFASVSPRARMIVDPSLVAESGVSIARKTGVSLILLTFVSLIGCSGSNDPCSTAAWIDARGDLILRQFYDYQVCSILKENLAAMEGRDLRAALQQGIDPVKFLREQIAAQESGMYGIDITEVSSFIVKKADLDSQSGDVSITAFILMFADEDSGGFEGHMVNKRVLLPLLPMKPQERDALSQLKADQAIPTRELLRLLTREYSRVKQEQVVELITRSVEGEFREEAEIDSTPDGRVIFRSGTKEFQI